MILTPNSFTHEYLSSLKFKELQKLSVQYQVNKRWAKKHELIENLLALNKKEETGSNLEEEKEWRDGSTLFNDLQQNKEANRRLTFNVNTKSNIQHTDPRLTFEVPQNGKNILSGSETFNSRETYDTSPSILDLGVEPFMESRATFDIPLKSKPEEEVMDPRATFDIPQNGKKLLDESEITMKTSLDVVNGKKLKKPQVNNKDGNGKGVKLGDVHIKDKEMDKGKLQMKTLTIPYARLTRRTRKDGEAPRAEETPIKMSKKSINIKKTTRLPVSKNNLIKSPGFPSVKNRKQTIIRSLTQPSQDGKTTQSKVPVRLNFNEVKVDTETGEGNKENAGKILRQRLSKTLDETLRKKSNLPKVNFRTPPPSVTKASKVVMPLKKTPLRKEGDGRLNKSAVTTPGVRSAVKPITATKMPDFSKIHKRQFEQMDSLHDYLKKKEERIKKLFGTPQPGQQLQVHNKTAPVFRFQSVTADKENRGKEILNKMTTPLKKKENDSKVAQKEAFKSKLPPLKLRSEIKDKNRSHIHGVRTNKRFELQMKFRNM